MTINMSQSRTLSFGGIYLKKSYVYHGQLYVPVSRVTSRKSLKLLIDDKNGKCTSEATPSSLRFMPRLVTFTSELCHPEIVRAVVASLLLVSTPEIYTWVNDFPISFLTD